MEDMEHVFWTFLSAALCFQFFSSLWLKIFLFPTKSKTDVLHVLHRHAFEPFLATEA